MPGKTPQTFPGPGHVYDLLVVGAGLSGSEAALGCAQAGLDVLLVTTSLDTVCLLAGDGAHLRLASGTLLAELVAERSDASGYLGSWALHRGAKHRLEHHSNLHLLQSSVSALKTEGTTVTGVETWEGVPRFAKRTAVCVGSFLKARLTVGTSTEAAGRLSEMAYDDLYDDLVVRGFALEPAQFSAGEAQGSLPYTVHCQAFSKEERDGFRLKRLERLYAAGVCFDPSLSYEAAAQQGAALASALIAEHHKGLG